MSSTVSQPSPSASSFISPAQAQEHFHSQFDLENPVEAVSNYARMMHDHTQRQMNHARRTASLDSSTHPKSTLTTQTSAGSLDSRGA